MRAAVLTRDGVQFQNLPVPVPGPGEILVRSLALGICEGDLFRYRSRGDLGDGAIALGHEGTGEVVATGEVVSDPVVGQRVTTLAGPYAEYYTAPASVATPVPVDLDPALALGEPLACCVHASTRFGIRPGDRVLLIGAGFMGTVCMHLAQMQGAAEIVALEPVAWRRENAIAWGADAVFDPGAIDIPALGLFDVILEATGVQSGIDLIAPLIRQHGRAVIIGYHQAGQGMRQVDMKTWNFKAIDVTNGHVRRNDEKVKAQRAAMALVRAGLLDLAPLVTAYPLAEANAAMADLDARREGLYKVVLVP
ncbi:MAG: zinc-dependent alcohol dehydrogenase [Anaerolineae bacterium]